MHVMREPGRELSFGSDTNSGSLRIEHDGVQTQIVIRRMVICVHYSRNVGITFYIIDFGGVCDEIYLLSYETFKHDRVQP